MMQPGDQHLGLADVINRRILANLESEDITSFKAGSQLGINGKIGMRSGQGFEFAYGLVVAVEFSICKSEAHFAVARRFTAAARTGTLRRAKLRSAVRKLFPV